MLLLRLKRRCCSGLARARLSEKPDLGHRNGLKKFVFLFRYLVWRYAQIGSEEMINQLNKLRLGIALSFVLAFSGMFICDALCDVGIIEFSAVHDHFQKGADHHAQDHEEDHHHTQPMVSDHHHNQSSGHDHDGPEEDECCEDITTPFFDNLIKHQAQSFEFDQVEIITLIAHYDGYETFIYNSRKVDNLFLYSNLPPPLPGDQIRIRFQSFLL